MIFINPKNKNMITIKRYTAAWCGPCKALAPIMMELQSEMNNVNFVTIDVDIHKEAATLDNVSSVPTIIVTKNGQEMHRFTGVKPKNVILSIINQFK
jgi:thioredoxin 1